MLPLRLLMTTTTTTTLLLLLHVAVLCQAVAIDSPPPPPPPLTNTTAVPDAMSDRTRQQSIVNQFKQSWLTMDKFPVRQHIFYHPTRLLGKGSYGSVYEATLDQDRPGVDWRVAVKCSHDQQTGESDGLYSELYVLKMLNALGKIPHTRLLDHFTVPASNQTTEGDAMSDAFKNQCLVMELIQGEQLATVLKRVRPGDVRSIGNILKLTAALLEQMMVLAELDIIHNDLSPDNIMVDASGKIRMVDFGLTLLPPNFCPKDTKLQACNTDSFHGQSDLGFLMPYLVPLTFRERALVSKEYGLAFLEWMHGNPKRTEEIYRFRELMAADTVDYWTGIAILKSLA